MSNIVSIGSSRGRKIGSEIRIARKDYGLTLSQAAMALDVSSATIESWEGGIYKPPSMPHIKYSYRKFVAENNSGDGKNLLFGIYPLRMARQLMGGVTVAQLAAQYNYKESAWMKFEANSRKLDANIVRDLEERSKSYFSKICSGFE